MTYGGTPINTQAERFLSHKHSKRHSRKKHRTVVSESAKRVCPFCGKRKVGLEAHIAAKHGGAMPSRTTPSTLKPVLVEAAPPPSPTRQKKAPVAKKRSCPICAEKYTRLSQHLSQAHDKVLTECPWCFAESVTKKAGKRRCGECGKAFTLGTEGKVAGIRAECPACLGDFYTERLGLIECPTCGKKTFINGKGKPC
jgi:hypothetical protein